jgi:hypothetical protein
MNQKMIDLLDQHIQMITEKYAGLTRDSSMLLNFGALHNIYDDYNLDDSDLDFGRKTINEELKDPHNPDHPPFLKETDPECRVPLLQDMLKLLDELELIPEDDRQIYEEEDEEDYP